jgi:hypothetical protein
MKVAAMTAGTVGALLMVAVAELAVRLLVPQSPQELRNQQSMAYQAWSLGPCYRASGHELVRVHPPILEVGPDPMGRLPLAKGAGVRRVVVVGESTGHLLEDAMAELVQKAGCHDVEILGCSADGSLPSVAVRRAREAMATFAPDVIVVALGHNFRLPGVAVHPLYELSGSRLAQVTRRIIPEEWKPGGIYLDPADAIPPAQRDPPSMGRDAYRSILEAARGRGVEVVAVMVASNLRELPAPEPAYLASADRATARILWARGDLHGAIAALTPPAGGTDGPLRAYE